MLSKSSVATAVSAEFIAHLCIGLNQGMMDGHFLKIKHPNRECFDLVYALSLGQKYHLDENKKRDRKLLAALQSSFVSTDQVWDSIVIKNKEKSKRKHQLKKKSNDM